MLREGLGTIESKTKETLPRRMRPRIAWQPPPQRLLLWILNLKSTTQWQRSSKVWTRKCRMKKPKEVPDTSLRSSKLKRTQLAKSKKYKARLVARGYMSSTIMEPTHPFPEWRPFEKPSEYETNNLIVKSIIWVKTRCEKLVWRTQAVSSTTRAWVHEVRRMVTGSELRILSLKIWMPNHIDIVLIWSVKITRRHQQTLSVYACDRDMRTPTRSSLNSISTKPSASMPMDPSASFYLLHPYNYATLEIVMMRLLTL